MELRHYLSILWKRAWLLALAPLLAGTVSLLISNRMAPVYQASTTLMVSQAGGSSLLEYSSLLTSEGIAKTYAQLLTKRPLLEKVIADLNLDLTASRLEGKISVAQPLDTQLIELRLEDEDPRLAIAIANAVAVSFVEQQSQSRSADLGTYETRLVQQSTEVENEIQELEAELEQAKATNDTSSQILNLQASLREARLTYATLLDSYLQIRATGGRSIFVEIVEPAGLPARKIRPRAVFNTFVAAFAGLTAALGLVFLLDYLDDTLTSPETAEQVLGIPALATIPRVRMRTAENQGPLAVAQPMSIFAEAHRALRTNVEFASIDKKIVTLLVTSAHAKEGKTTTVANLGVVMAQAGMRVVLVDTDLRNARLHETLNLPNQRGLTDLLLAETMPDESCLFETFVPNLRFLPSGSLPATPSELLGSDKMKRLIDHLATMTDVLLFDSPPIRAVTDGVVLASRVDGVLLVIASGQTPKEEARKALNSLQGVGARVLGTVLTQSTASDSSYYYYGYGHRQSRMARIINRLSPVRFFSWLTNKLKGAWRSVASAVGYLGHLLIAGARRAARSLSPVRFFSWLTNKLKGAWRSVASAAGYLGHLLIAGARRAARSLSPVRFFTRLANKLKGAWRAVASAAGYVGHLLMAGARRAARSLSPVRFFTRLANKLKGAWRAVASAAGYLGHLFRVSTRRAKRRWSGSLEEVEPLQDKTQSS